MANTHLLITPGAVARVEQARLAPGRVVKHPAGPMLVEDRPWEPRWDDMKPSVWYDAERGRTHLWYTPFIFDACPSQRGAEPWRREPWPPEVPYHVREPTWRRELALCYACSDDGIHWVKPELGLTEWNGSTANNILLRDPADPDEDLWMTGVIGSGVGFDDRETDPARRFKMVSGARHGSGERGLAVACSPDGMHWPRPRRVLPPEAWPHPEATWGDAHNTWLYSSALGRYVAFTQGWDPGGYVRRLKLRVESEDFEKWTDPEPVVYEPDVEIHTHVSFTYAGLNLALVHRVTTPDGEGDGTLDVELALSSDTRSWHLFAFDRPLIPRGEPGDIDCGCIFAAMSPIVKDDEIRLYYCGDDGAIRGWRRGAWCLATLKRDRWAGYQRVPLDPPGIVETGPVTWEGADLSLNVEAPRGSVGVSVLDETGAILSEGRCAADDSLASRVAWADEAAAHGLAGRAVRLRFTLRAATLFAFAFEDHMRSPGRAAGSGG